jgi:flagellar basal body-associated protein FliL
VTLFVNATLGGKTVQSSPVTITISQGSGSTTSSSGTTMLVVVLVVVAVVVVVAVLLLMKKRKPHGSTPAGQEAPYVAPPQTPSSPPGPPA